MVAERRPTGPGSVVVMAVVGGALALGSCAPRALPPPQRLTASSAEAVEPTSPPPSPSPTPCRGDLGSDTLVLSCTGAALPDLTAAPNLRALVVGDVEPPTLEGLRGHPGLEEVHLVGTASTLELDALATLPRLRRLRVQGVNASSVAAMVRALGGLEELSLAPGVGDLRGVAALPRLRVLRIEWNERPLDLAPLGQSQALEEVSFHQTEVASVASLRAHRGLRRLTLRGSDGLDLSPLADLPELRVLTLYGRAPGPGGPKGIERLEQLHQLVLAPDEPVAGAALRGLVGLSRLDVQGDLDARGLEALPQLSDVQVTSGSLHHADVLQKVSTLRSVRIAHADPELGAIARLTQLRSLGLGMFESNVSLAPWTQLESLAVDSLDGVSGLERLTHLTALTVGGGAGGGGGDLSKLHRLPLEHLALVLGVFSGGERLELPALRTLEGFGDAVASVDLRRFSTLEDVSLSYPSTETLEQLSSLASLRALSLRGVDGGDLKVLRGLRALTTLRLEEGDFEDLSALDGLAQLEELVVVGRGEVVDLTPLVGRTRLRRVTLTDVDAAPGSLAPLTARREVRLVVHASGQLLEPRGGGSTAGDSNDEPVVDDF